MSEENITLTPEEFETIQLVNYLRLKNVLLFGSLSFLASGLLFYKYRRSIPIKHSFFGLPVSALFGSIYGFQTSTQQSMRLFEALGP